MSAPYLLEMLPTREVLRLDHPSVSAMIVQKALLEEFLPSRRDVVLFGAHAVNVHVSEEYSRTTRDIDLYADQGARLAREIMKFLSRQFPGLELALLEHEDIYGRPGRCYRIYEPLGPKKARPLVDVWQVFPLPPHEERSGVQVITLPEAIAEKTMASLDREDRPEGLQDLADLLRLLEQHPEYKIERGPVRECLEELKASSAHLRHWAGIVKRKINRPRPWFPPQR